MSKTLDTNEMTGWVSLAEAAARLPSPRPGKRTACSTVYRIARRHGLEIRRLGQWRYVRWSDLVELFKEDRPKEAPRITRKPVTSAWAKQYLKDHGLA